MKYKDIMVLTGDELFLIDHFISNIRKQYISGMEDMNLHKAETIKGNVEELANFMNTVPFLVEKKVLIIENCEFLTSKKSLAADDEEKLMSYIDNRKDNNIMIFNCYNTKLDSRKKLFKKLNASGSIIDFPKFGMNELKSWITTYLSGNSRNIKDSDAFYLTEIIGYLDYESLMNLYDVKNELNKLIGFTEKGQKVSMDDINQIVKPSIENNIFKLVDHICEGDTNKAYEMVVDMIENNVAAQYIFHMIARHYRLLLMIVAMEQDALGQDEMMKSTNLRSYAFNKMRKQIRMAGDDKIREIYEMCYTYDKRSKVGLLDIEAGVNMIISAAKK
ncbi:MAG: DNA polymerase III subunit delta [Eubacteriales bacterium]|nr:DNA polymerase III subunit delta [Eubacteriales bacterium]